MTISKLIERLTKAKEKHGDFPVSVDDGMIVSVRVVPCQNGVCSFGDGTQMIPNEFFLDFRT